MISSKLLLLASSLCLAAGCGPKAQLPSTYPVHGKVVFRQGGPLAGGDIYFQSEADPNVSAAGLIAPDGAFEVTSFIAGARAAGAVPGRHRVLVIPPSPDNSQSVPSVPPQFVEVAPGENDFTITIDNPAP
jgi:hypothetical protein